MTNTSIPKSAALLMPFLFFFNPITSVSRISPSHIIGSSVTIHNLQKKGKEKINCLAAIEAPRLTKALTTV
ncbi:hypothetical protein V8C35DRAFT_288680 [Trichoderma chlorosporum]